MKKLTTLVISLILALTACLSLTACSGGEKVVNVRTKTVTVGYTDYAPMNYVDDNGVLTGFDTELALTVFNALGYEVKFKLIDWGNKYMELDGGTIDCIWNGFTANSADDGVPRNEIVDFTNYYMQNAQCIVRKSSTAELTDWSGFTGKSVAYETSSAADSLIADQLKEVEANKKGKTAQMDAIKDVNSGVTDYAVVDILLAQSIVGQGDYADLVINTGIEIGAEYYAIGFKKGSELTQKVNVMLEALGKVGYTMELATKYGLENSLLIKG